MAQTTIEWTGTRRPDGTMAPGFTFNSWWGCEKASPACTFCYAEAWDARFNGGHWGGHAPRRFMGDAYWKQPFKWNRQAQSEGLRLKVFSNSMSDVFEQLAADHPDREKMEVERTRLFDVIRTTPHLDWLLLTKRPENIMFQIGQCYAIARDQKNTELRDWLFDWGRGQAPANVWMGTTVENQHYADLRVPRLLKIPATVRFLSCEPLLGPVNLTHMDVERAGDPDWCFINALTGRHTDMGRPCPPVPRIHWIIAGGESGDSARPMNYKWADALRRQCNDAKVAYFFKQWGEWQSGTKTQSDRERGASQFKHGCYHDFGDDFMALKLGKKDAGRLLNGVEWSQFPTVEVPE